MPESTYTSTSRVVELEIKPINWKQVIFPKAPRERLRKMTEDTLLTGIGMGVLLRRGIRQAVDAAYQAGSEEAEHPGPVMETLLALVRKPEDKPAEAEHIIRHVPVLPIADYDNLSETEIIAKLDSLDSSQLNVVRRYESTHQNRPAILAVIEARLGNS